MSVTYKLIDGDNWQWAEDYGYLRADYIVACPAGRSCQVGMGVFMFGQPRGEKVRFSGEEGKEITVVGVGALHFRVDDGLGPCQVAFVKKADRPFTWTWSY